MLDQIDAIQRVKRMEEQLKLIHDLVKKLMGDMETYHKLTQDGVRVRAPIIGAVPVPTSRIIFGILEEANDWLTVSEIIDRVTKKHPEMSVKSTLQESIHANLSNWVHKQKCKRTKIIGQKTKYLLCVKLNEMDRRRKPPKNPIVPQEDYEQQKEFEARKQAESQVNNKPIIEFETGIRWESAAALAQQLKDRTTPQQVVNAIEEGVKLAGKVYAYERA
jgi:hypothetical protein